jgi:hypothetical protein
MADAPSTPRVRAHRERRSLGVCSVQVRVDKNSIEGLVRLGGASPSEIAQLRNRFIQPSWIKPWLSASAEDR